ncbi:MAG TPA: TerC family protein [bacterium]|nr:TerC family protein [bacterium]
MALFDPEFWARGLGIVLIDLALAGDNALVIALAVRTLPRHQQTRGQVWGAVGAVALRVGFIVVVTFLLNIPLLQLAGGVVLMAIAVRLTRHETGIEHQARAGATLIQAVGIIVAADVIMSLDNVLAVAAAARGRYGLVVVGVGLSLPLVVWGSSLLARLMHRQSWIVWLAGGVLGYVSGEMILRDPLIDGWLGPALAGALRVPVPLVAGIALACYGWWTDQRSRSY